MNIGFDVKDAVTRRYSVRTYEKRPVEREVKETVLAYAESIQNPLGPKCRVQLIEKATAANGEKLGTYGVINGADVYLGVTTIEEPYALEALGYAFEQLVLYAASLGLGTCWLGGTFNRSAFVSAMQFEEGEIFPILSPLGYPSQKKSIVEQLMRRTTKADDRLPWERLFFKDGFTEPLTETDAGEYQFPLEMLRLAPSAVNKQPWSVVADKSGFHFFQRISLGGEGQGVDMHRIDMGIAICHFHLAAMEQGLQGQFQRHMPDIELPAGYAYIVSWKTKN